MYLYLDNNGGRYTIRINKKSENSLVRATGNKCKLMFLSCQHVLSLLKCYVQFCVGKKNCGYVL